VCGSVELGKRVVVEFEMDRLIQTLDTKLRQWQPDVVEQVRQCLVEIIELADQDALDLLRSRAIEQEVLDLLDEPEAR
jgi:hypothetical protein